MNLNFAALVALATTGILPKDHEPLRNHAQVVVKRCTLVHITKSSGLEMTLQARYCENRPRLTLTSTNHRDVINLIERSMSLMLR